MTIQLDVRNPDVASVSELSIRSARSAHVSLLDRLTLRLGLWLLLRSERSSEQRSDDDAHVRLVAGERARLTREHAAFRDHALGPCL